jgi:hypothetical protein
MEDVQNEGVASAVTASERLLVATDKAGFKGGLNERLERARKTPGFGEGFKGDSYAAINDLLRSGQKIEGTGDTPQEVLAREQTY